VTEPKRITIRPATPEDAGAYLMLVEALAVYEKMPPPDGQAKTRLIEHLFGARPYYKLLVACDGGKAVGYAAYLTTYSTFLARPTLYLEDLFVLPEYRSLRVGHRLFVTIARIARAEGCGRVDFMVLRWNKLALDFYAKHGVKDMAEEWALHRVQGDEIRRVAESDPTV
jgi:GNAT superfamily N-acetyltransferase